jgi:hypothetical protein
VKKAQKAQAKEATTVVETTDSTLLRMNFGYFLASERKQMIVAFA